MPQNPDDLDVLFVESSPERQAKDAFVDLTARGAGGGRAGAGGRGGAGPAVVFCHGTPWSSRLWSLYAEALASEYTVYLWDMPGYGESSMRPEHPVDLGVQG